MVLRKNLLCEAHFAKTAVGDFVYHFQRVVHPLTSHEYLPDIMGGSLRWSDVRLTFENHDIVWHPDIAKNAFSLFGLQVNTVQTWPINKNVDSIIGIKLEFLCGVPKELSSIGIPGGWKVKIEVRILLQHNPPVVYITRKIPEDLRRHWLSREELCGPRENGGRPQASLLTMHNEWFWVC